MLLHGIPLHNKIEDIFLSLHEDTLRSVLEYNKKYFYKTEEQQNTTSATIITTTTPIYEEFVQWFKNKHVVFVNSKLYAQIMSEIMMKRQTTTTKQSLTGDELLDTIHSSIIIHHDEIPDHHNNDNHHHHYHTTTSNTNHHHKTSSTPPIEIAGSASTPSAASLSYKSNAAASSAVPLVSNHQAITRRNVVDTARDWIIDEKKAPSINIGTPSTSLKERGLVVQNSHKEEHEFHLHHAHPQYHHHYNHHKQPQEVINSDNENSSSYYAGNDAPATNQYDCSITEEEKENTLYNNAMMEDDLSDDVNTSDEMIIHYPIITSYTAKSTSSGGGGSNERDIESDVRPKSVVWSTLFSILSLALSFIVFASAGLITRVVTLLYVIPRINLNHHSLPDIVLDNIRAYPYALQITDTFISIGVVSIIVISLFNKTHRSGVIRRFLFLQGLVLFFRIMCVYSTTLSVPYSEDIEECRLIQSMPPSHRIRTYLDKPDKSCGDYLFSGHSASVVLVSLFILRYTKTSTFKWDTSNSLMKLLRGAFVTLCCSMSAFGMYCVIWSKGHYTVDVIIGFWVAISFFYIYHAIVEKHWTMKKERKKEKTNVILASLLYLLEFNVDKSNFFINEFDIGPLMIAKRIADFSSRSRVNNY